MVGASIIFSSCGEDDEVAGPASRAEVTDEGGLFTSPDWFYDDGSQVSILGSFTDPNGKDRSCSLIQDTDPDGEYALVLILGSSSQSGG